MYLFEKLHNTLDAGVVAGILHDLREVEVEYLGVNGDCDGHPPQNLKPIDLIAISFLHDGDEISHALLDRVVGPFLGGVVDEDIYFFVQNSDKTNYWNGYK